jgi:hypothetical protein
VTGKSLYINNDISAGFLNASFREKKKKGSETEKPVNIWRFSWRRKSVADEEGKFLGF